MRKALSGLIVAIGVAMPMAGLASPARANHDCYQTAGQHRYCPPQCTREEIEAGFVCVPNQLSNEPAWNLIR